MEAEFLTVKEIADRLRITQTSVYRMIERNEIVAYKIGKQFRIKQKDFDNYMKRICTGPEE